MKKRIAVIVMTVVAASVAALAQYRVGDALGAMMIEGRPFMTDAGRYNSYYMAGSPLGRFEMESDARMDVELGYRHFGLGDESGNYLSGQAIRMGEPGRAVFELFYGPDILSRDGAGGVSGVDMTLHRFGLSIAGRAGSGFFQAALSAEGYIGDQKWDGGDSTRTFMGFDRIRIDMGSVPHPLARVTFFIDATLRFDSLKTVNQNPDIRREYSVQTNLPEIGVNIDFGGEDMPVRSNLFASHAWSRFTYGVRGLGTTWWLDSRGDGLAIVNDSFQLYWMTQGRIPIVEDAYVIKPGLLIGMSNNSGRMHEPDPKDNSPIKLGDVIPNRDYDLGGFYFGVGSGFELLKYADIHVEYMMASMSLDCGSAYTQPVTDKRTLHHTSFGASSDIHKYVEMPVEVTARLAYFMSGSTRMIPPRHATLDPLSRLRIPGRSLTYLYEPARYLDEFTRTSGFTFGVDAKAFDMLSLSYWMTFLSDNRNKDGMELGLSFGLSL